MPAEVKADLRPPTSQLVFFQEAWGAEGCNAGFRERMQQVRRGQAQVAGTAPDLRMRVRLQPCPVRLETWRGRFRLRQGLSRKPRTRPRVIATQLLDIQQQRCYRHQGQESQCNARAEAGEERQIWQAGLVFSGTLRGDAREDAAIVTNPIRKASRSCRLEC